MNVLNELKLTTYFKTGDMVCKSDLNTLGVPATTSP